MWWAAAAVAATVLAAALILRPGPEVERTDVASSQEVATEFFPMSFGQPLLPGESLLMVRISVPRSEMSRFGLPAPLDPAEGRVKADVVLGGDGIARAIRFVE